MLLSSVKPKQLALYTEHLLEMEFVSQIFVNVIIFLRRDRSSYLKKAAWVHFRRIVWHVHYIFLKSNLGWMLLQNEGIVYSSDTSHGPSPHPPFIIFA